MEYIKKSIALSQEDEKGLKDTVSDIIYQVRNGGDEALKDLVARFDRSERESYFVTREEIDVAYEKVDERTLEAMKLAAENIRSFAEKQRETILDLKDVETSPGVVLGHRVVPVDSCMCYVPGGNYPLFSTALMLLIPAKVAGVKRICACSPAKSLEEGIDAHTLVAMDLAGVDEIAVMGGAQSVAAYSYGTETIDPVAMIVGPGNKYVTEAKRQCYGQVGIDFPAGPSEILIVADDSADVKILAADLLGQSEHDLNASAVLVSDSKELLLAVGQEVERQLGQLETADVARESWENNGELILADSLEEATEISNSIAPEHLEVQVEKDLDLSLFRNYGSMFIGPYSAEVFGDYTSGTNHTLPTSGTAKFTGGLFVGTFLKTLTYQKIERQGFKNIKDATMEMAAKEGLKAHYNAVKFREGLLED